MISYIFLFIAFFIEFIGVVVVILAYKNHEPIIKDIGNYISAFSGIIFMLYGLIFLRESFLNFWEELGLVLFMRGIYVFLCRNTKLFQDK